MSRLISTLLCLALTVAPLATAPEVEVGDVYARVILGPDEDGDLYVSIKVSVTNNTDAEKHVVLSIQGLDSDEFEVYETTLSGNVEPKETETITDTAYIEAEVFQAIYEWRVEK